MKHAEYRLAIEAKAQRYGYVDAKSGVLVLDDAYFLAEPTGWVESVMGSWAHDVARVSTTSAEEIPDRIAFHRSEHTRRVAAFNNYYRTTFDMLIRARERMKQLESNDVDIKNAIRTIQQVSQSDRGYHQLGKSEVMKCVLDFMGPNSTNYTVLTENLSNPKSGTKSL